MVHRVQFATLRRPTLTLAVALVVAWGAWARAQDGTEPTDLARLQERLRRVAAEAAPKTVCVEIDVWGDIGYGSGAIIAPEGLVLTCAHVVEPAVELTVITSDGRRLPARQLGLCSRNDYALLKVDAADLPAFEFGDSAALAGGEWVAALGHPGGPFGDHQPSVALGRVRGLHRQLPVMFNQKFYNDAILTDCPIFGGSSGGPLVDLDGRLLGINGAILLVNDNGYAIPIHQIAEHLDTLKEGGDVEGQVPEDMGQVFRNMQDEFGEEDLRQLFGERFSKVFERFLDGGEGGPLSRLMDPERMREIMERVFGDGSEPLDLERMLEEFLRGRDRHPASPAPTLTPAPAPGDAGPGYLGVTLGGPAEGGVRVEQALEGTPALRAGLREGDVIYAVAGRPTPGEVEFAEAMADLRADQEVVLSIRREGWERDIHVVLGSRH
ncbi:MAG: trypsin-like peptidase domain-containing protein [Planctomycetes bacterium]|nr:trypsin-like peptidase domain-containing protein [Planctomycetota bacterium]